MKEIIVISGKGGTGKTSFAASFATLAGTVVLTDCDVDAANLHCIASPQILSRENFSGGNRARIKPGHCIACGKCEELCRFDAVFFDGPGNGKHPKTFRIDPVACEGCGVCAWFCAENAIEFKPAINGVVYVSNTRFGPMVHAKMGVAEENSGKLVTRLRKIARKKAEKENISLIISDGSPGIGCPVIASLTGADYIVAVTEPTLSGKHDIERVMELIRHFSIPAGVVVNKWDINPSMTEEIEKKATEYGIDVIGKVRYDTVVKKAIGAGKSVIEYGPSDAARELETVWARIIERIA